MKKLLSIIMAVAMIFTMGMVAFADETTEYVVGETYAFVFTVDADQVITKVYDVNGFITFDTAMELSDETGHWYVKGTMKKVGITQIVIECGKDHLINNSTITIVNPKEEKPVQPGDKYLTFADLGYADEKAYSDAFCGKSKITFDMTGFDGVSAEIYNATTKLNPEMIIFDTDLYTITLNRNDYVKLTVNKDVEINAMVSVGAEWIYKDVNMNNKVLAALGNNKAVPFYVAIDSTNLTKVAPNAELTLKLNIDAFDKWCKVNDCKSMDIYAYDVVTDKIALVKADVSVNNLFDKELVMPTIKTGYYVIVESTTPVSGSVATKPNVGTGGNSAMSALATLVVMGAVAVATKKIVK